MFDHCEYKHFCKSGKSAMENRRKSYCNTQRHIVKTCKSSHNGECSFTKRSNTQQTFSFLLYRLGSIRPVALIHQQTTSFQRFVHFAFSYQSSAHCGHRIGMWSVKLILSQCNTKATSEITGLQPPTHMSTAHDTNTVLPPSNLNALNGMRKPLFVRSTGPVIIRFCTGSLGHLSVLGIMSSCDRYKHTHRRAIEAVVVRCCYRRNRRDCALFVNSRRCERSED